jgi:hypothetical protein
MGRDGTGLGWAGLQINNPSEHIGTVLERVKPEYIFNQYAIRSWEDPVDFLRQFCIKTGRSEWRMKCDGLL